LQPFRLTQLGWFEREEVAAAQVFRLALQYSPNATLVLYQTWTTVTTNANPDAKFVSDMRYVTNYFEFFMDAIRQEFPGRAVFAVPSGLALMKLAEDIVSGAGPEGIPCITNIFDPIAPGGGSSIHPRVDGYWLSCLVHFNSYYSEHYITHPERFLNMPTNIPFTVYWQGSNAATWTYWPSVTSNQSAYFQDLAWHVVTNYPRTFLSNVPRVKGDWTPPSAPENIVFSGQTTSSVTVSWSASTDNVAVLRYTVMVNRDYAHTLSGLSTVVMLTNVVNPQAAEVTVRAWDTSYNFADATRALPEPAAAIAGAFAVACARRARAAGAPRRRA
ncbi:fibronectin type III domain-containing protein, partial [bacterium]|nr:fibronectin type III domain-containing protein [bacterium]